MLSVLVSMYAKTRRYAEHGPLYAVLEENDEGVEATDPDPVPLPLPVPDPLPVPPDPNAGVLVVLPPPPISVGVPLGTLVGVAVRTACSVPEMAVRVDM